MPAQALLFLAPALLSVAAKFGTQAMENKQQADAERQANKRAAAASVPSPTVSAQTAPPVGFDAVPVLAAQKLRDEAAATKSKKKLEELVDEESDDTP